MTSSAPLAPVSYTHLDTPNPTAPDSNNPWGLAVSPNGLYVYASNLSSGGVSQYAVGAGGMLTADSTPTVSTGGQTLGIAISPDSAHVYVTDSGGALTMDGFAARFQAYDRILKPETQRGVHAHHLSLIHI